MPAAFAMTHLELKQKNGSNFTHAGQRLTCQPPCHNIRFGPGWNSNPFSRGLPNNT
ncbi:unnamed protein product [Ixodes persulcatus]